jgi:Fic family protein
MNYEDFSQDSPGTLTPTIFGQKAFVPSPLPPIFDMSAIAFALADAMNAIGELNGACRQVANANILIRPLQRQEALTSSAMEGTYTTADRLVLAEMANENVKDDSTLEVRNYIIALNQAVILLEEYPLSHRVIKSAHKQLLSGLSSTRGSKKRPGEYKVDQNFIGSATERIEDARFIPPPPDDTLRCMDLLEKYMNNATTSKAQSLIDIALIHYQIETIHPFGDGNGRLGRMLITLMAQTTRLTNQLTLYISPSIEKDKDRYIDLMYKVSAKGQWENWLNYFFQKISQSCQDIISRIDNLTALQSGYKKLVADNIRSGKALLLIDSLFEKPAMTVTQVAELLDMSYNAAQSILNKLEELKILTTIDSIYPKTYLAPGVIIGASHELDAALKTN